MQSPISPILPARETPAAEHSKWSSFRAFPIVGQLAIAFGVVLSALLGVGIVGAIAASPKPAATPPLAASPDTTVRTTSAPQTTTTVTTVPAATVPAATVALTVSSTIAPTTSPTTSSVAVLTAAVVDGDTVTMSDGSTVRLIGIDTPEAGQCGFAESSALLGQFILGQNITLVTGARDDVDRYGRLLRYVEANGVDVDLKMIESGRATARYDGRDGYGIHQRQDAYVEADELSASANVCATVVPATAPPVLPVAVLPAPVEPEPVAILEPAAPAASYQNCTAVRAAGAAPIYAGDPGWQSKFDRDGDGVGCE